jgi:hypothetical protein
MYSQVLKVIRFNKGVIRLKTKRRDRKFPNFSISKSLLEIFLICKERPEIKSIEKMRFEDIMNVSRPRLSTPNWML